MKRTLFTVATTLWAISALPAFAQEAPDPAQETGTMSKAGTAASSAIRQTRDGFADAAMSPLEDLNLRRDEIPPLLAALKNPYDLPHMIGCYEITVMVRDLDAVLGPDWDAPKAEKRAWNETAADGMAGAALNTVSDEASGMIPLRGVARKLTGAEKHAKAYARAFQIGGQRRAYLKGLGQAKNCGGNAAPRPFVDEGDDKIVYRSSRPAQQHTTTRRVVTRPSKPSGN